MSQSKSDYVKCSIPNCCNNVGYHNIKSNKSKDGYRIVWKNLCEKHRNKRGKDLADRWKLQNGCGNKDGRYGFVCTSVIIHPAQLQINHKDGNNLNRDETNIEVLCGNCHIVATLQNRHHLQHTTTRKTKIANPDLFKGI